MVFQPEPLFRAVDAIRGDGDGEVDAVVLMSPQGRRFTQREAERIAGLRRVVVLCGRYEGVDDRVRSALATEEVSVGDYVLSGGELPALVIVDAVVRLLPGAVGDEASVEVDSFSRGLLDHPHFTRPAEFRGLRVPDVLLSGNHVIFLGGGGSGSRWRARWPGGPTCCRRRNWMTKSARFCAR